MTKKLRFFGARSPSKLVYIGAKGAFRKILGSVRQKWISEKVSKGGPFGSAGGRIPDGGGGGGASAFPLNPPLPQMVLDFKVLVYISFRKISCLQLIILSLFFLFKFSFLFKLKLMTGKDRNSDNFCNRYMIMELIV